MQNGEHMTEKNMKKIYIVMIAIILTWIVSFGMVLFEQSKNNAVIDNVDVSKVEDVTITYNNGKSLVGVLPFFVDSAPSFTLDIHFDDYVNLDGKAFNIRTYYSDFQCIADGKVIYEHKKDDNFPVISGAYSVHLIDIPKDLKDNTISIKYKPLTNAKKQYIPVIYFGTRKDIILYFFFTEVITISIIIFLIAISIIGGILSFASLLNKKYYNEIMYTSLLSLFIALYFSTKLWVVEYLLSNHYYFLYFLENTMIFVVPIVMLQVLKGKLAPLFDKIADITIIVGLVNIIVQYTLVLLKVSDFKLMSYATNFVVLLSLVTVIVGFYVTDSNKYPRKLILLVSTLPLVINVVVEGVIYSFFGSLLNVSLMLIGAIIFIGTQSYTAVSSYISLIHVQVENESYMKLALTDQMTDLPNRTSYSEELSEIEKNMKSLWIISMDLNNLKQVNDFYGHETGDKLIKEFSEALKKAIKDDWYSKAFRIGGDEFIVFIYKEQQYNPLVVIDKIKEYIQTVKSLGRITINFSYGLQYHEGKGLRSIDESIIEADAKMYKHKEKTKVSNIRRVTRYTN